ncbi:MAG: PDZ domain-containing protein [Armatimonadetes bacterium]|nr:PDZ domain-containing protein [Armatimonadota bacterium]
MNFAIAGQRIAGWILLVVLAFTAADLTAAALDRRLQVPPQPLESAPPGIVVKPELPAHVGDLRTALQTSATVQPPPTSPAGDETGDESPAGEPAPPALSQLRLKGTVAGGGLAMAIIESGGETRGVGLGEEVAGYTVIDVGPFSAQLQRDGQVQTLTMEFDSSAASPPPPPVVRNAPVVVPPAATPAPEDIQEAARLSMDALRSMLDNPESYAGKMRLTPVQREGDTYGMLLQFTAGDNPLAKLGLRHGDIVLSLNGKPLRSPEDLNKAYMTLRNSPALTFQVERNGQQVPVTVTLDE